jgi:hypothetical protein
VLKLQKILVFVSQEIISNNSSSGLVGQSITNLVRSTTTTTRWGFLIIRMNAYIVVADIIGI